MITEEIKSKLLQMRDEKYKEFHAKLIPNVDADSILGIRTPELRKFAKEISKREDIGEFLKDLPHEYYDENQLHSFVLSEMKDFETCLKEVEAFLPYVNNWATCDQLTPKVFKKNRKALLPEIKKWIASDRTYTVRFAIKMLMDHFLDEEFDTEYPETVAAVCSEEYYIMMMQAWYFATALAKQYDAAIPWIEAKKLPPWVHNKTIQKAIESYRVSDEQKAYLRTLKTSVK